MITEASPARLFAAGLKAAALAPSSGNTSDWTVVHGQMPSEKPIRRLSTMSASPITWFKDPRNGNLVQHLGVQVFVRSQKTEDGYLKALAIINRMVKATPAVPIAFALDGIDFAITHVVLASGPIYVGEEETYQADMHSINFLFTAEYA